MSELKPCPFCGGEAMRSCIPGAVKCMQCGASTIVDNWNTRPAPELPEGYSMRDGSSVYHLWHGDTLLAWFTFGDNLELTDEGSNGKHAQALAIWLQKRAR